jgi:hypothetical protein
MGKFAVTAIVDYRLLYLLPTKYNTQPDILGERYRTEPGIGTFDIGLQRAVLRHCDGYQIKLFSGKDREVLNLHL